LGFSCGGLAALDPLLGIHRPAAFGSAAVVDGFVVATVVKAVVVITLYSGHSNARMPETF
jgi:hypothetical protein